MTSESHAASIEYLAAALLDPVVSGLRPLGSMGAPGHVPVVTAANPVLRRRALYLIPSCSRPFPRGERNVLLPPFISELSLIAHIPE